jgi:hypothetical protein
VVIAVAGEDSAEDAPGVLAALVRAAAGLSSADPEVSQVAEDWSGSVRRALWKGTGKNKHHAIRVVRGLATWLAEHPDGVVVLHFDADVPWAERRRSENTTAFRKAVVEPLERHLASRGKGNAVARLVGMVPHWHLEAWTYRNLSELASIAGREKDLALLGRIEAWTSEPALLDEEASPKKLGRVRDRFNLHLVTTRWPAAAARSDGKSFAAFVDALAHAFDAAHGV